MKRLAPSQRRQGFTLIEIMVVVAIMGLIMAMGVPSILTNLKKDGVRRAVSDLEEVYHQARQQAIMQNKIVSVVFHPQEKRFECSGSGGAGAIPNGVTSAALPEGVDWEMLDINQMDFTGEDVGWVRFFPDGTCDESVIILRYKDVERKITLEFATAMPFVTDKDK